MIWGFYQYSVITSARVEREAVHVHKLTARNSEKSRSTFYSTLLFFLLKTITYFVCELLQIRGHRFDSGTRLHPNCDHY